MRFWVKKLHAQGGSIGLYLPIGFVRNNSLEPGEEILIYEQKKDELLIVPSASRPKYIHEASFDELLEEINRRSIKK